LIGGFSQTEVIAYLKAKLAAGKAALQELGQKEENQETLLQKGTKKDTLKELSEETELDIKDEKGKND
jgi:predicted transcriptional regulator